MTTNTKMQKFNTKQLWYLATVCGFTIGLGLGTWFWDYNSVNLHRWEIFFWVPTAVGAGLGMGLAQWFWIRRLRKNSFLWIITTIGIIVILGGALLVIAVTSYYHSGTLSWLYSHMPGWFVPLTYITPIIIFIGPLLQWLMVRSMMQDRPLKEFVKISIGWITSIVILFVMLGLLTTLVRSRNEIVNMLAGIVATIPSGLIFAYSTLGIIRNSLGESRSL